MKHTRASLFCLAVLLVTVPAWGGSTAITGEQVYPSQNDLYGSGVGGLAGDGKVLREKQWRKALGEASNHNSYIISGGTLPATDPDLTIQVAAGKAILDGTYVEWPATNITLPASQTNHIFLKLVFSGDLITGAEIEDNTSGTAPAKSLQLGTAVTSGSAVTSTGTAGRIEGPSYAIVFTSSSTFTVNTGQYRAKVRVYGAGGGGGGGGSCGGGGPTDGNNGSVGGTGGTTTFGSSVVSANGGGGGAAGIAGFGACPPGQHGAMGGDATTATGHITLPGLGMPGGTQGGNGGRGGRGAYAESYLSLTPGGTHSITIGAGGTAGNGGADNGFGAGAAGSVGQGGRIVIEYLP